MREKILELVEDILNLSEGTLREDTCIEDVEGWDSLTHVLIIGDLETKLGISIPVDEAIEIATVGELLKKAGV